MQKRFAAHIFVLSMTLAPQIGLAKLGLKTGLWEIESSFNSEGKTIDPQAQMREAMAKMPPDQAKKMKEMMAQMGKSHGVSVGPTGHRICLDDLSLSSAQNLSPQDERKNCEYKIDEKNPKIITMSFNCKDGATGKGNWELFSDLAYKGSMSFLDKNQKRGSVSFNGKFLGSDCQGLKPVGTHTNK